MDTRRNFLYDLEKVNQLTEQEKNLFLKAKEERVLEPVPLELEKQAKKKLKNKPIVKVNKYFGGQLAKFAAKKRKIKRRMQKLSRRKNRK